jgi:hypothetical protein
MMKQTLLSVAAVAMIAMGCGRGDIEESQRSWLEDQHRLEKRLLEVRADHNELRRALRTDRAGEIADEESLERFNRADAILGEHESKLNAMDTMIDRHSLARDNAIRADDAAAVGTGWAAAKVDYAASMAALDAIDKQNDDIADVVKQIRYRSAPDTIGTNAGVAPDSARADREDRAPRKPDPKSVDPEKLENNLGREEPLEPE